MMTTDTVFSTATEKEIYETSRYEIIKMLEEGGHENTDLYPDSKGLVSTGVGFNLHSPDVLDKVLQYGFGVSDSDVRTLYASQLLTTIESVKGKTKSEIQEAVNERWRNLRENEDVEFTFLYGNTEEQAKNNIHIVFDVLAEDFEETLANRLSSLGVSDYSGVNYESPLVF